MAYIRGEAREQTTMFAVTLDELLPADHVCRVIEAFVEQLNMFELKFVRAEPAETGRPGYDPRALLKLYLYGYQHQVRSSRRLEAECQRNVEVMWLLGRLQPDYKSIAEFRRMHSAAVTEAGAELLRLARTVGFVKGETVAVDGSKLALVKKVVWIISCGSLETGLKHGIELVKDGGDVLGQALPSTLFERRDSKTKFELERILRVKVTTAIAAHDLQLPINGFNGVGGGERTTNAFWIAEES